MPERSFGRVVRYRRTKLGISQAKLGELVGRSPSTIRSWERDKSVPNDPKVLVTLSAVLGVDERTLFGKAGQKLPPALEDSPTLEDELASLRTEADEDDRYSTASLTFAELVEPDEVIDVEEPEVVALDDPETVAIEEEPVDVEAEPSDPEPSIVTPDEPYVITVPSTPVAEPSYVEDESQVQVYRVRTVATLVAVVALVVAFLWAFAEGISALSGWWDAFVAKLRL